MFTVRQDEKYGVILTVDSRDEADEVDDFLTENFCVLFELREQGESVEFFFGQASSISNVKALMKMHHNRAEGSEE